MVYERQREWGASSVDGAMQLFVDYAEEIGLDIEQFRADLESHKYQNKVQQDYENAVQLGLGGTPTLFINGQLYDGPRDEFYFVGLIKLFNYDGPQYATPPEMAIDPSEPYFATFETNQGTFCAELYAEQAPQTVNSFVFLAGEGYFDGIPFHRVLPGFVAQSGDPSGGGFGGPGYRFADEFHPDLVHDAPGLLSMANAGPDTNGSQFFITLRAVPELDGKHSVFGKVVAGYEVVESLIPRDPQQDPYAPADTILSVTIGEACSE